MRRSVASKNRQTAWLLTTLTGGTKKDRVGALKVLLEEAPVGNAHIFPRVLKMCQDHDAKRSLEACQAVKEVMISSFLPDRHLKFVARSQSLLESWGVLTTEAVAEPKQKKKKGDRKNKNLSKVESPPRSRIRATEAHLVLLFFEEYLKITFAVYLNSVTALTSSTLTTTKLASLRILFDLLVRKPEQEGAILDSIVRKLADREKKVFAAVKKSLLDVCRLHRGMKSNVIESVAQFGWQTGAKPLLLMHSVEVVASVRLFQEDAAVAAKVTKMFLEVLAILLNGTEQITVEAPLSKKEKRRQKRKRKGKAKPEESLQGMALREDCGRLVRMLLVGLKRALPLLDASDYESLGLSNNVAALYRLAKEAPAFKVRVVVLVFLFELLSKFNVLDRDYYIVLHQQLSFHETYTASNRDLVLRLLARIVETDKNPVRVAALVRRVAQCGSHVNNTAFQQGVLELLCLASDKHPAFRDLLQKKPLSNKPVTQAGLLIDDEEERFEDLEDDELASLRKRISRKKSRPAAVASNDDDENDDEDEDEIIDGQEPPAKRLKLDWKARMRLPYSPELCFPTTSRALNGLLWEIDLLGCHYNLDVAELVPLLSTREAGGSLVDPTVPLTSGKKELLEMSLSEKEKRYRAGEQPDVHSDSEPDDEQIDSFLDSFFAREMGMDDMEGMLDGFSDGEEEIDDGPDEGEVWGEVSSDEGALDGYEEIETATESGSDNDDDAADSDT